MKPLKKLNSKKGFTLFESMASLLIIVILTIGVTTGISAAANIYKKSVFNSESEMLASTMDEALADILRYASDVSVDSGVVKFTNANYSVTNGHFVLKKGWMYLNINDEKVDNDSDAHMVLVINGGVYTSMVIDAFDIDFNDGVFSGNYVIKDNNNDVLTKDYDFCFRILN